MKLFDTNLSQSDEKALVEYKPVNLINKNGKTGKISKLDTRTVDGERLKALKALKVYTTEFILEHAPLEDQLNGKEGADDIKFTILEQYKTQKEYLKGAKSIKEIEKPFKYSLDTILEAPKKAQIVEERIIKVEPEVTLDVLKKNLQVRDKKIDDLIGSLNENTKAVEFSIQLVASNIAKVEAKVSKAIENLNTKLETNMSDLSKNSERIKKLEEKTNDLNTPLLNLEEELEREIEKCLKHSDLDKVFKAIDTKASSQLFKDSYKLVSEELTSLKSKLSNSEQELTDLKQIVNANTQSFADACDSIHKRVSKIDQTFKNDLKARASRSFLDKLKRLFK